MKLILMVESLSGSSHYDIRMCLGDWIYYNMYENEVYKVYWN